MITVYLSIIETDEEKSRFEKLYERYRHKMYFISYAILGNEKDAEDSVQQSFLAIANHFEKIKKFSRDELEAYITVIVRNQSINIYNENKKFAERLATLAEAQNTVDVDFFENMDYESLIEVISSLPQKYKDVLLFVYVYGFSPKDTADMLGVSENTVYKRAERAKILLKEKLSEE